MRLESVLAKGALAALMKADVPRRDEAAHRRHQQQQLRLTLDDLVWALVEDMGDLERSIPTAVILERGCDDAIIEATRQTERIGSHLAPAGPAARVPIFGRRSRLIGALPEMTQMLSSRLTHVEKTWETARRSMNAYQIVKYSSPDSESRFTLAKETDRLDFRFRSAAGAARQNAEDIRRHLIAITSGRPLGPAPAPYELL